MTGTATVRCPRCRARNPETAEWCSQCYTPLVGEEPDAAPSGPPAAATDPAADAGAADPPDVTEATAGADERDFRRGDAGLEWRCPTCGQWNDLDRPTCEVCGRAFDPSEPPEGSREAPYPESVVVAVSVAVPGAGHLLLGRPAGGIARFATWLLWLAGGLWLLRGATTVGGSPVPAVPLLLGAAAIWITAPVDALLLRRGDSRELLRPRVFLWLVVGVIGFLLLSFLVTALALPDTVT